MAVTGWKYPSAATNTDYLGGNAWQDMTNLYASDNNYSDNGPGKTDASDILTVTQYGFTSGDIPNGATIDGIEVEVEVRQNGVSETIRHLLQYGLHLRHQLLMAEQQIHGTLV